MCYLRVIADLRRAGVARLGDYEKKGLRNKGAIFASRAGEMTKEQKPAACWLIVSAAARRGAREVDENVSFG